MTQSLIRRAPLLALMTAVVAACGGTTAAATMTPPAVVVASAAGSSAAATPSEPLVPSPSPDAATVRDGEPWIVYQGGRGGPAMIRLVRPDGSGDHVLAPKVGGEQAHPDWSHDGRLIAFVASAPDGTTDLWTVRADGSEPTLAYDCVTPCHEVDDPAWSPDDRSILLVRNDDAATAGDGVPTVAVLDLARARLRTVLSPAVTDWAVNPRWNRGGDAFVTELDRFGSARFDDETILGGTVGVVQLPKADGSGSFRALLPWSSRAAYPDWSPLDDRVVAVVPADPATDPADLVLLSLADPHPRRITDFAASGGWGIQPTWTPDGERILFVGEDVVRTQANAASIQPDGTGLDRLPWDGTFRTHPRLRPTP